MKNIISQLTNLIPSNAVSEIAKKLGESESAVQKGINGIFPMLLGSVMKKANDFDGKNIIGNLVNIIKEAPPLDSIQNDQATMDSMLNNSVDEKSTSGKFMSLILGDKVEKVTSFLTSFSGLKASSVSSLLNMCSTLLSGFLGKSFLGSELSTSGLMSFLSSQKDEILKSAPEGLNNFLGIDHLSKFGHNVTDEVKNYVNHTKAAFTSNAKDQSAKIDVDYQKANVPKKSLLFPILGLAALVAASLFLLKTCTTNTNVASYDHANDLNTNTDESDVFIDVSHEIEQELASATHKIDEQLSNTIDTVSDTTTQITDNIKDMTSDVSHTVSETVQQGVDGVKNQWNNLGTFFQTRLPSGTELTIPQNGIESKIIAFIDDPTKATDEKTWFSFDRILFETGSANLDQVSDEQLGNIAEVMKAYPEVKIKVGGYTDDVGSDSNNLALSQKRADAIKKELVNMGVTDSRIVAKGYGETHPVAPNTTDENRAKNRRIDVLITNK